MTENGERQQASDSDWDDGSLGCDEQYVAKSDHSTGQVVDENLGLKLVSIRLGIQLIQDLKTIANQTGYSGYQPLAKAVLTQFVRDFEGGAILPRQKKLKKTS